MTLNPIDQVEFVTDAETLDFVFSDPSQNMTRAKISDAFYSGRGMVTFMTMQELKINCDAAHKQLKSLNVVPIRKQVLTPLATSMLSQIYQNGCDHLVLPGLMPKIYLIALARSKKYPILTRDCRDSEFSTRILGKMFGVRIVCLDHAIFSA